MDMGFRCPTTPSKRASHLIHSPVFAWETSSAHFAACFCQNTMRAHIWDAVASSQVVFVLQGWGILSLVAHDQCCRFGLFCLLSHCCQGRLSLHCQGAGGKLIGPRRKHSLLWHNEQEFELLSLSTAPTHSNSGWWYLPLHLAYSSGLIGLKICGQTSEEQWMFYMGTNTTWTGPWVPRVRSWVISFWQTP